MLSATMTIDQVTRPTELAVGESARDNRKAVYLQVDVVQGSLSCVPWRAKDGDEISGSDECAVRLRLPLVPTASAANTLMEQVLPLAKRIMEGTPACWDGENHVGRPDRDAVAAAEDLVAQVAIWARDAERADMCQPRHTPQLRRRGWTAGARRGVGRLSVLRGGAA
jgi:hypothetical protein